MVREGNGAATRHGRVVLTIGLRRDTVACYHGEASPKRVLALLAAFRGEWNRGRGCEGVWGGSGRPFIAEHGLAMDTVQGGVSRAR